MTEQLKQAERALDRMSGYMPRIYKDDIEIVRRALTTSQPAQAGSQWWERCAAAVIASCKASNAGECPAGLPTQPAAQATRDAREADQRARMQARLATRPSGKANADFDLPAHNDAIQQATTEPTQHDGTRGPFDGAPMNAEKAAYFMRRFKREEKLLGPNEQRSFMQQFDDARANIAAISQAMERSTPQQATQQAAGEPLQGGLDNAALLNAWRSKLPGVTPTDAQMTAFALGVEVGFAHARTLERSDWSRVHDVLKKAGVHPGRTDDHLADVIAKALFTHPAPGVPEGFTSAPPAEQGWYWHWNGDEDSRPIPTSVLWSGSTGTCFVSRGQLGLSEAIDCDKYGGYWLKLNEPWDALAAAQAKGGEHG